MKKRNKLSVETNDFNQAYIDYKIGNETLYTISIVKLVEVLSIKEWVEILKRIVSHNTIEEMNRLNKILSKVK